jgi:hypothetical protein
LLVAIITVEMHQVPEMGEMLVVSLVRDEMKMEIGPLAMVVASARMYAEWKGVARRTRIPMD